MMLKIIILITVGLIVGSFFSFSFFGALYLERTSGYEYGTMQRVKLCREYGYGYLDRGGLDFCIDENGNIHRALFDCDGGYYGVK